MTNPLYRCFFLDAHGDVVAHEDITAETPEEAIEMALASLAARSHHHGVEVWCGGRRIYPAKAAVAA